MRFNLIISLKLNLSFKNYKDQIKIKYTIKWNKKISLFSYP